MIQMGQCRGIRYAPTTNTSTESDTNTNSELVSWFLQYPDGSMGMLYTTPVRLDELAIHTYKEFIMHISSMLNINFLVAQYPLCLLSSLYVRFPHVFF